MLKKYKEIIILLVILIGIFQLYLYTTFPAFKNDDSPETITSAYTLGISHPPGYPLFTMAAKISSLLPIGSPAFRVNSFAIFLAMLVLLLSYFIIRQITFYVFNYQNRVINFLGVFILAFSYIFWNQAIEAKGGIYILNLLFLTILIYLSMELLKGFNIRYLYLISFVYGLSLANHWPSMIILLPVFGYSFLKHRKQITGMNLMTIILLLLAGLSPYIYLPIRARTNDIFVFMSRPDTWENFWETIFRTGYTAPESPGMDLYVRQIQVFLKLFINDFYILWILIIMGGYAIWKKSRELFYYYLGTCLITILMVLFYNRSNKEYIWVIDNFLMPAQYIFFIMLISGIYFVLKLLKRRIFYYSFLAVLIGVMSCSGYLNFQTNNSRYNYIAYDFGDNIIKTIEPGSFYFPGSDFYEIPIDYFQHIQHIGDNFNYVNFNSIQTKWGIKDFTQKYGYSNLKEHELMDNICNIINNYISQRNIYFSYPNNKLEEKLPYVQKVKGLLYKTSTVKEYISPNVFETYAYRNIYDAKSDYDKLIVSSYSERMAMQAEDYLKEKNFTEAKKMYDKALIYAEKSDEEHIFYDIALGYGQMGFESEAIRCLKKSIAMKNDDWQAYAALGMIYYNEKILPMAKDMFEKAIQYGSDKQELLQAYINAIRNGDKTTQYEAMFNQATSMLSKGEYDNAVDIYEYLLKENYYRTVDIYKNIGVYNFQTNKFEEALKYFQKAKEKDKNASIYAYIAYAYYKLGQPNNALNTLREAMQEFGNDPQLTNLYNQIEQVQGIK